MFKKELSYSYYDVGSLSLIEEEKTDPYEVKQPLHLARYVILISIVYFFRLKLALQCFFNLNYCQYSLLEVEISSKNFSDFSRNFQVEISYVSLLWNLIIIEWSLLSFCLYVCFLKKKLIVFHSRWNMQRTLFR